MLHSPPDTKREPVDFPAVLPGLCDEIADKANGRG
jgi:hypothetical protein